MTYPIRASLCADPTCTLPVTAHGLLYDSSGTVVGEFICERSAPIRLSLSDPTAHVDPKALLECSRAVSTEIKFTRIAARTTRMFTDL